LEPNLFSLVVFRLGRPVEERDDIFSILGSGARGACSGVNHLRGLMEYWHCGHTIVILDKTVEEYPGHRNRAAREIRVVIQPLANLDSSRWVNISSKQRINIVLIFHMSIAVDKFVDDRSTYAIAMPSFDDQAQVGR
jgi:hypothetical protein